jgi:two-component system sensor histidine kinase EvgS
VKKYYCLMLSRFIAMLTFLTWLLPVLVLAEPAPRTLKVGWCVLPGYQEYNEQLDKSGGSGADAPGVYSGYTYEYLKNISYYTGWQYQFVAVPKDELLGALENGRLDLVAMMTKTPERQARFLYPDASMGTSAVALLCRKDDDRFSYGDYRGLNGIRIGVNRYSVQPKMLKQFGQTYHFNPLVVNYDSYEDTAAALSAGKVDAIIANLPYVYPDSKILIVSSGMDFYFITSKKHPELANALTSTIQQIKYLKPDFDDTLLQKYFPDEAKISLAFSKDEQTYLEQAKSSGKPIVVQFDPAWEPIEYKDPATGELRGVMADIFARLSKETGLKFKFVTEDTYAEAVLSLGQEAELASTLSYDMQWAEEHNAYLTQPVFNAPILMVTSTNREKYNLVALPKGYHLTLAVQNRLKDNASNDPAWSADINYQLYGTMDECVEAVRSGKAGRTYINSYELNYYMNTGKLTNLNVQNVVGFSEPTSIGVSKTAPPQLLSVIAKSLRRIPQGELNDILIKNTQIQQNRGLTFSDFIYLHPVGSAAAAAILAFLAGSALFFYYNNRKTERQREELLLANNAKNEFMKRMSHDMRTPMNAIIGLTEIARSERPAPEMEDYLGKINHSSQYLLRLIDNILDISKLEKDNYQLHPGVLTWQAFTATIDSTIGVLSRQAGVKLITCYTGQPIPIFVDVLRFNQIFISLLDNAIKYTPSGREVWFEFHCGALQNGRLHLTVLVKDSGIGIAPQFLPHIFEPFSQDKQPERHTEQGSGLGLAIVKRIVDLFQGTITATSKEGCGTTFSVELDVSAATPKQLQKAAAANPEVTMALNPSKPLAGKRLLVAEDNLINQQVIAKILKSGGMTFDLAGNGRECVTRLVASPEHYYDGILMDIRMPVLGGLEAAQEIRHLSRSDHKLPIIALTADAYADTRSKAMEVGMDAFVTKPVYPQELYRVLEKVLK